MGRYSVNIIYFVFFLFVLGSLSMAPPGDVIIKNIQLSGHAQGTTWHANYFYVDSVVTKRQLDSILDVIDSSLSIYKPYSKIVAFNNSTSGIKIDKHFRNVIEKSLDIYQQTNGLSDITVGPLVAAWGFGADPHSDIPNDSVLNSLLPCVDSKNIRLRNDSLIKSKPCVKIDVNGIAQGYSVHASVGWEVKASAPTTGCPLICAIEVASKTAYKVSKPNPLRKLAPIARKTNFGSNFKSN